jgi:hypothetical protein
MRIAGSGWLSVMFCSLFGCEKQVGLKSSPSPRCFAQSTQRWKCSGLISLRSTGRFDSR